MFNFDKELFKNKILIVSDVDDEGSSPEEIATEKEYIETKIKQMKKYGADVDYAEVLTEIDLRNLLTQYNPSNTLIFNWCERLDTTDGTECIVAQIYEDLGFVYTGADLERLRLVADKYKVKEILNKASVKTPEAHIVKKTNIENFKIDFSKKYIVKSNNIHASSGLTKQNVVNNYEEYLAASRRLVIELNTDILVEEFINGNEYTVVVWGNENPQALSVIQVDYHDPTGNGILTNDAKFGSNSEAFKDSPLRITDSNDDLSFALKKLAVDSFKILNIYDYARFDFRVSGKEIYVIDANANPYINVLDGSEVYMSTSQLGYNYGETILQICEYAFLRDKKTTHILKAYDK